MSFKSLINNAGDSGATLANSIIDEPYSWSDNDNTLKIKYEAPWLSGNYGGGLHVRPAAGKYITLNVWIERGSVYIGPDFWMNALNVGMKNAASTAANNFLFQEQSNATYTQGSSSGIGGSKDEFQITLVGPDDYLSIDVENDTENVAKMRVVMSGDEYNLENAVGANLTISQDVWVQLEQYGNIVEDVVVEEDDEVQGPLLPPDWENEDGTFGGDLDGDGVKDADDFDPYDPDIQEEGDVDDAPVTTTPTPQVRVNYLQYFYDNPGIQNNPFYSFNTYGDKASTNTYGGGYWWGNPGSEQGSLWLTDDDSPDFWFGTTSSSGVRMEIKSGHYVELKIFTENDKFFNTLSWSPDEYPEIKSVSSSGKTMIVKLYGGDKLWIDIDNEFGIGASFALMIGNEMLVVDEVPDDEVRINLLDYGEANRPPKEEQGQDGDTVLTCPPGYEPNEDGTECVLIQDGGGDGGGDGNNTVNPPVWEWEEWNAPFTEDDGLLNRLTKSFSFGVNNSLKAGEAIIEGALMAAPAVIVIVGATFAARFIINKSDALGKNLGSRKWIKFDNTPSIGEVIE